VSLKWRVARVRAMSSREIAFRVGRAVRARAERWGLGLAHAPQPMGPAGKPWLSTLPRNFEVEKYTAAADKVLAGVFHVFAMENAPLGFPGRDQFGGAHEMRLDVCPAPDRGHCRCPGREPHDPLPERFHVQRRELRGELLAGGIGCVRQCFSPNRLNRQ